MHTCDKTSNRIVTQSYSARVQHLAHRSVNQPNYRVNNLYVITCELPFTYPSEGFIYEPMSVTNLFDNDNDNELFVILTVIHSKDTFFDICYIVDIAQPSRTYQSV